MVEAIEGTAKRLATMVENTKCMKRFHDDARAIANELMKMEKLPPREHNKVGCCLCKNPTKFIYFGI